MRLPVLLAGALATSLLTVPGLHAQNINDTIVTKTGTRIRAVEVTEMTVSHVGYVKGDTEEKIAAAEVAEIVWDDAPELLLEAQGQLNAGDHGAAANLFAEAADRTDRTPLKLEAEFFAARAALAAAGNDEAKARAAQTALQSYLDSAGDGFYSPHAKLLIARALRTQGKNDEAESALQSLEQAISANNLGVAWDARAKFERAQGLLAGGQAREARGAYQRVVTAVDSALTSGSADPELADLKVQSVVREGETYVAEENPDEALAFFRKHTRAPTPGESTVLQAAALAGEGAAMFAKSSAGGDAALLREAQTVLARAAILDTSNGDTTAKALFYLGKILQTLGPDAERDAKTRSMAYFDKVARNYGSTRWAAMAQAEVDK